MATKFTQEHVFATAGVDQVLKMYAQRAFFEKKYAALGYANVEILDFKSSASGFSVTARYDTKNDAPLPDFAKKFMASSVTVTQTDTWDVGSKTGTLSIDLKGVPAKVSAVMKLVARGGGSVNVMDWTVSVGIPLIGGKLESVLAEDIKAKSPVDAAASANLVKELT